MTKTSTQTGIFFGVDRAEYDAIDAVNQSRLKPMAISPLQAEHEAESREESEAMRFGTAVHVAVLEPDSFNDRYHIMPACDKRTKEGKALYHAALHAAGKGRYAEALAAANSMKGEEKQKALDLAEGYADEGKIIMPDTGRYSYQYACEMGKRMHAHPDIHQLFSRGHEAEAMLIWTDPITKLLCKGLVDAVVEDAWPSLGDVKTARQIYADFFSKEMYDRGYYIQAPFYLDGYKEITGKDANFVIAVTQNEPPHDCALYPMGEDTIKLGRLHYRRLMARWLTCVTTGNWPGLPQRPVELDVPSFRLKELNTHG